MQTFTSAQEHQPAYHQPAELVELQPLPLRLSTCALGRDLPRRMWEHSCNRLSAVRQVKPQRAGSSNWRPFSEGFQCWPCFFKKVNPTILNITLSQKENLFLTSPYVNHQTLQGRPDSHKGRVCSSWQMFFIRYLLSMGVHSCWRQCNCWFTTLTG